MKTQRNFVEQQLKENGKITRNLCLQNYITRLGAIICNMRHDGWDITGKYEGKDYVYRAKPKGHTVYKIEGYEDLIVTKW